MPHAICKYCRQELPVMTWSGEPKIPSHLLKQAPVACEGSNRPTSIAAEERVEVPTFTFGKIPGRRGSSIGEKIEKAKKTTAAAEKLKPELGNSRIPNWYEPQEDIPF